MSRYKPSGAVDIGRPGPYGNRYRIGRDGSRAQVVALHRDWLSQPAQAGLVEKMRRELPGRELWCPGCRGTSPCHGDNIRELLAGGAEEP